MPAPSAQSLELFIKNALLAKGYVKQTYVGDELVKDPTQLPDELAGIVAALGVGLSLQWALWESTTIVSIPVTSVPGTPSVGILV